MHSFSRKLLSLYLACSVALSPLIPAVAQVSAPVSAQQQNLPELGSATATIPSNVPLTNPSSDWLYAAEAPTDLGPAALRGRSQGLEDAVSRGVGLISGAASQASRNWFDSHHITSELALKAGEGGVRGGSLDLLMPFYNEGKNLLFVQSGVRRADTYTEDYRNTVNLGLGYRRNIEGWLLGGNSFYDWDVTGKNARLGVGVEAWTDFLKLSANGYQPLSDWKVSPDQADYLERPAKGWDLRAEGYLASYPQLGAKVAFEQFYGDEVSLFGVDNRQKDPRALSVGVIYNPIPLIGLSVDHRVGQHGIADTSANLALNYRIGEPLAKQLSSSNVMASRMLENIRYDLVSRNNEIVIDHKKDGGQISLPDVISDTEFKIVPFAIKGAATFKSISWTGTAASFALPYDGSGQGTVQLPAYDNTGVNIYSLQAVGTDKSGRAVVSNPMQVSVQPLGFLLTANPAAIPATGTHTSTITVKILGASNLPRAAGLDVHWTTSAGKLSSDSSVTDGNGEASVTLTSTTVAGNATVEATYGATKRKTIVDFTAGAATAMDVTASPDSIEANGTSTSTISATVKDANGNLVAGETVSWSKDLGELSGTLSTTNASGVATIELTSATTTGKATVTAAIGSLTDTAEVDFTTGAATALDVTASPDSIEANGTSTSTISATVKDGNGNLVAGKTVSWSKDLGELSGTSSTTNASGVATIELTSATTTGKATVTAAIGSLTDTAEVDFTAGAATAMDVTASPDSIEANGTSTSTISVTVKDGNGNLVPGKTVSWSKDLGELSGTSSTTNASGVATIELTSATAVGSATVTASSGTVSGTAAVAFTPRKAATVIVTSSETEIGANGVESSIISAEVLDSSGNPLPAGTDVSWTIQHAHNGVAPDQQISTTSQIVGSGGIATYTLSHDIRGRGVVSASVDGVSDNTTVTYVVLLSEPNDVTFSGDGAMVPMSVNVTGPGGRPLAGVTVTWETNYPQVGDFSPTTSVSGVDGVARITYFDASNFNYSAQILARASGNIQSALLRKTSP